MDAVSGMTSKRAPTVHRLDEVSLEIERKIRSFVEVNDYLTLKGLSATKQTKAERTSAPQGPDGAPARQNSSTAKLWLALSCLPASL